jgi:hypothetical protein
MGGMGQNVAFPVSFGQPIQPMAQFAQSFTSPICKPETPQTTSILKKSNSVPLDDLFGSAAVISSASKHVQITTPPQKPKEHVDLMSGDVDFLGILDKPAVSSPPKSSPSKPSAIGSVPPMTKECI